MSRPPTQTESLGMFLAGLVLGHLLRRVLTRSSGIDWDEELRSYCDNSRES